MKNKKSSSKLNFLYEKNESAWRRESAEIFNKEENLANLLNLNPQKYSYYFIPNVVMVVFWGILFLTASFLIFFCIKSIFIYNKDVAMSIFVLAISFYGSLSILQVIEHYCIGILLCIFIRVYDVESHITQGIRMVGRVTEIKDHYEMQIKVKNDININYISNNDLNRKYNYKNAVPIIRHKNKLIFL